MSIPKGQLSQRLLPPNLELGASDKSAVTRPATRSDDAAPDSMTMEHAPPVRTGQPVLTAHSDGPVTVVVEDHKGPSIAELQSQLAAIQAERPELQRSFDLASRPSMLDSRAAQWLTSNRHRAELMGISAGTAGLAANGPYAKYGAPEIATPGLIALAVTSTAALGASGVLGCLNRCRSTRIETARVNLEANQAAEQAVQAALDEALARAAADAR